MNLATKDGGQCSHLKTTYNAHIILSIYFSGPYEHFYCTMHLNKTYRLHFSLDVTFFIHIYTKCVVQKQDFGLAQNSNLL